MASSRYAVRLDEALENKFQEYVRAKNATVSDALRGLIQLGLSLGDKDVPGIAKSLDSLSTSSQHMVDRLAAIETDLAELVAVLPSMQQELEALLEHSGDSARHRLPALRLLCELLVINRLAFRTADPNEFGKLKQHTAKQFDFYLAAVDREADTKGLTAAPQDAISESST